MSILPEEHKQVKPITEIQRWAEKKRKSKEIAHKLRLLGKDYTNRSFRMEECGNVLLQTVCPVCGDAGTATAKLCRDRLCPVCQWRLSKARFAQMIQCIELMRPVLLEEKGFCQMITLTIRNPKMYKLKETIKKIHAAWNKLNQRVPYRNAIAWARNLEITISEKDRSPHPHLHILIFWKGSQRAVADEAASKLGEVWGSLLGVKYTPEVHTTDAYTKPSETSDIDISIKSVDFKPNDTESAIAAAVEASKYIVKEDQISGLSLKELRIFDQNTAGIRFSSYGGLLRKIRSKLGLQDDDYTCTDSVHCHCGAKLVQCVLEWNGERYEVKALQKIEEWSENK